MKFIFNPLYDLHPALPIIWLLVMANGLGAFAIYTAIAKSPYDIGRVWQLSRSGSIGATYALWSWVVFVAATIGAIALAAFHW